MVVLVLRLSVLFVWLFHAGNALRNVKVANTQEAIASPKEKTPRTGPTTATTTFSSESDSTFFLSSETCPLHCLNGSTCRRVKRVASEEEVQREEWQWHCECVAGFQGTECGDTSTSASINGLDSLFPQPQEAQEETQRRINAASSTNTSPAKKLGQAMTLTNVIGYTMESDAVKVAMAGPYLVIGERRMGNGLAQVHYRKPNATTAFSLVSTITALEGTRNFGDAVDIEVHPTTGQPALVVGASRTMHETMPQVIAGSVHYMTTTTMDQSDDKNDDDNHGQTRWTELGGPIRNRDDTTQEHHIVAETGGRFGAAVALASSQRRMVVGAPASGVLNAGKVFTYHYYSTKSNNNKKPVESEATLEQQPQPTEPTWVPMTQPLVGEGGANTRMGTSVDMNEEGTKLLVGAPGANAGAGQVLYYEWEPTTATWIQTFTVSGTNTQGLGSAVQFIQRDGSQFIVGGPVDKGGIVQVYRRKPPPKTTPSETDTRLGGTTNSATATTKTAPGVLFTQMGNTIEGTTPGEQVGSTVCGKQGRIAFGTALGSFHVYDYNPASRQWEAVADNIPVRTGSEGAVVSIAMSDNGQTVSVGLEWNQQVRVYDLLPTDTSTTNDGSGDPALTAQEGGTGNVTVQQPPPPTQRPTTEEFEPDDYWPSASPSEKESFPTLDIFAEEVPPPKGSFVVLIVMLVLAVLVFICLACGWC